MIFARAVRTPILTARGVGIGVPTARVIDMSV
jgi:hypothetical protein